MTRKPRSSSLAALAAAFTVAAGLAQPGRLAATATRAFKSAVNTQVAAARRIAPDLGVHVVELGSGDTVYSFYPDTRRIIASNTKLFTSAAALDRLGPGFFFETEVLIRGEIRGATLIGDLAVVGGGDPHLSGRQYDGDPFGPFRDWAAALKGLGIERIAGTIYLVHGLFDDVRVHPDWPEDQLTRWYEAPVDALSFSDNCVLVKVRPNGRAGLPAVVETVPPVDLFTIESTASTTAQRNRQWVGINRKSGEKSHVLTVSGRVHTRTDKVEKWITVTDPPRYFGAGLVAAFAEEGIEHQGELRPVDALDPGGEWTRVHTHRTDLLTVLEVVNKRSQNFYSESVLKLLGAKLCGSGTWEAGIRLVREFLAEIGIEGAYTMADGSGMSRNNRFTPRQLTQLLAHMFEHRWGREFARTLPFSGEPELRWERRLAQPPYRNNVVAKTGYLSAVSTLSGYAKARSGKVYAFAILCNRSRSGASAKAAQDRIVKAIIDHG